MYRRHPGGIPPGWVLSIACTGGTGVLIGADSDFDAGDTTVSIRLKPLENVTCTYTNEQVAPTVTVDKSADPTTVSEFGGPVTYTVVVTNTSAEVGDVDVAGG